MNKKGQCQALYILLAAVLCTLLLCWNATPSAAAELEGVSDALCVAAETSSASNADSLTITAASDINAPTADDTADTNTLSTAEIAADAIGEEEVGSNGMSSDTTAADEVSAGEANAGEDVSKGASFDDSSDEANPNENAAEAGSGDVNFDENADDAAADEANPSDAHSNEAIPEPSDATELPERMKLSAQIIAEIAASHASDGSLEIQATTLNGIDISGWQAGIDVSRVPADFVIIKATEETTTRYNTAYRDMADTALAAGKLIGFYHFARDPREYASMEAQASAFVNAVAPYLGTALLVLDWESTSYSYVEEAGPAAALKWLDAVYAKTGVRPLIYMNKNTAQSYNWSEVAKNYGLWIAQYLTDNRYGSGYLSNPRRTGDYGAWGANPLIYQYSDSRYLSGYEDQLDINIFYGDRAYWKSLAGGGAVKKNGWFNENGSYYHYSDNKKDTGWLVTDTHTNGNTSYGLQRYWLDKQGKLAVNKLISDKEAGWWAFARPEGFVVRGRYTNEAKTKTYLANNDGRLENPGFLVSSAYGQGTQYYLIDASAHAAVTGYRTFDGAQYYTTQAGYLARGGTFIDAQGQTAIADDDGKVHKLSKNIVTVHRLYNPNSGEHFYTTSITERNHLVKLGWRSEGIGWFAPQESKTPVYRLYNPNAGDHHYTTSLAEQKYLVNLGWRAEGIAWYADDNKSQAIYRQYNPNARTGTHNFTSSKYENDSLVKLGWRAEGIAWYALTV